MSFTNFVEHTIDRFVPASLDGDLNDRKRVRLFLLSHIGGPVLGLQIPFILALLDPHPFPHVHILAASVLAFWAFPFPSVVAEAIRFSRVHISIESKLCGSLGRLQLWRC